MMAGQGLKRSLATQRLTKKDAQFRVGQKKLFFEIKKRGFLNPGKSAKNIF